MSPFCAKVLSALAVLVILASPSHATVNLAATVISTTPAPKSCSGAFRYAARVGNTDIVEVSPVQAFARDRRLARVRYTARGMYDTASLPSPFVTAMCGAR